MNFTIMDNTRVECSLLEILENNGECLLKLDKDGKITHANIEKMRSSAANGNMYAVMILAIIDAVKRGEL